MFLQSIIIKNYKIIRIESHFTRNIILCQCLSLLHQEYIILWNVNVFFEELEYLFLRASLCKILISSFAHKMDFAHNFSVDVF